MPSAYPRTIGDRQMPLSREEKQNMTRYELVSTFGKAETDDMNTAGLLADAFLEAIGEDREDGDCNRLVITDNQTGKDIWVSYRDGEYQIDGDICDRFAWASQTVMYKIQEIGEDE